MQKKHEIPAYFMNPKKPLYKESEMIQYILAHRVVLAKKGR